MVKKTQVGDHGHDIEVFCPFVHVCDIQVAGLQSHGHYCHLDFFDTYHPHDGLACLKSACFELLCYSVADELFLTLICISPF